MSQKFEGYYWKHQKGSHTLCVITGHTEAEDFIQIITGDGAWQVPFTEGNHFSKRGIVLKIQTPELSLTGKIGYRELSPIRYDIMGPFRLFPMECSHGIVSMQHRLSGSVRLNGEIIDFTGGRGYIEKDSGTSFPKSYTWIHANSFRVPCSIMAAVASIPFCGGNFQGCICVIQYRGREYRLATYLGVRVLECTDRRILLKQGCCRLEIRIRGEEGQSLRAPARGNMTRTILESASCPAEFLFSVRGKILFRLRTRYASFEYERSPKP